MFQLHMVRWQIICVVLVSAETGNPRLRKDFNLFPPPCLCREQSVATCRRHEHLLMLHLTIFLCFVNGSFKFWWSCTPNENTDGCVLYSCNGENVSWYIVLVCEGIMLGVFVCVCVWVSVCVCMCVCAHPQAMAVFLLDVITRLYPHLCYCVVCVCSGYGGLPAGCDRQGVSTHRGEAASSPSSSGKGTRKPLPPPPPPTPL